jgi:hypothetical protein
MSKIKSITQKTYNNLPAGFEIVIDDNGKDINGVISGKDTKSDKNLKVGDEVTYTIVAWKGKNNKEIPFATIKKLDGAVSVSNTPSIPIPTSNRNSLPSNVVNDKKVEACFRAMSDVMGAFSEEKLPWEKVKPYYNELRQAFWDDIDSLYSK